MQRQQTTSVLKGLDTELLQQELTDVGEIADRVRIAQFGLARPLLAMRQAQLEREAARVTRRKGANHPEAAARAQAAARMATRVAAFEQDLARLRIDPPTLKTETGAALYGRVVDAGEPVGDLTIVILQNGERLGFACTDPRGSFALEVPAGDGLVVSVRTKDGVEPFRDPQPFTLQPGQKLFREIDLAAPGTKPCPEPPEEPTTPPETVAVPDLVGLPPEDAAAKLKAVGLRLGQQQEQPAAELVGRVVAQSPEAGTAVRPGSAVAIKVGVAIVEQVAVPGLVGLPLDKAEAVLKETGLGVGRIAEVEASADQAGRVVRQAPAPPAKVPPGATVDLWIGVPGEQPGGETVRVPNLIGRTVDEATVALDEARLKRGDVRQVETDRQSWGRVVAQEPNADATLPKGSAVQLQVGSQPLRRDVPPVPVVAERAELELRERGIATDQPTGFLARRLEAAEVRDSQDLDALLARDRREVRDVLGLRTLSDTDRTIAALKRFRMALDE
ncbi:PASTA domain-containing protein [Thioalkalicoccus limnaeus]|uniref:PASTA domain-containing protein n=1 Tax=Thioalkalicoccus limnaeus TaxID=120681 RepID=A0ABV4BHX9_9GAMM